MLTTYTFNVQRGVGTDGVTDYARQVAAVADGDLIAIQERVTGETGWNSHLEAAGLEEAVYRENDPTQGDGPAIWYNTSRVTIHDTYQIDLSQGAIGWDETTNVDKAAVAVKCTIEGCQFYFISTHLAWSAGADEEGSEFSAIRVAQLETLVAWRASTLTGGLDVILGADLNLTRSMPKNPSGLQMDVLSDAGFVDCRSTADARYSFVLNWRDLNGDKTADMLKTDPITHDTREIDYKQLLTLNNVVSVMSVEIVDLRTQCSEALTGSPLFCPDTAANQRWGNGQDYGKRPSDHNPVRTIFRLNTPRVTSAARAGASARAAATRSARV